MLCAGSVTGVSVGSKGQVDLWLGRGEEVIRLYGRRPQAAVDQAPGVLRLVLQPVVAGVVVAWRPYWEAWMTVGEVERVLDALAEQGWELRSRPKVGFRDAGRGGTEALEGAIPTLLPISISPKREPRSGQEERVSAQAELDMDEEAFLSLNPAVSAMAS